LLVIELQFSKQRFLSTCRLWVFDHSTLVHQLNLAGGEVAVHDHKGERMDTFASFQASVAGLSVYGSCRDSGDIIQVHIGNNTSTSRISPVHIRWPSGLQTRPLSTMVLGCSRDRSLLIATSAARDSEFFTHLFHVSPTGEATLVAGDPEPQEHAEEEDEDSDSYEWVDISEGMTGARPLVHLERWKVEASGHLIGFTRDSHVVRLQLSMPVPPALLQADTNNAEGISFTSCEAAQLRQDLGGLLASGEGADVQLKCAEGRVLRAHSHLLLARWEYYRVLQRNLQAGMTGGGSTGEVDVSEHSAATMQLVLQHLYTGRVQLPAPAAAAQEAPTRAGSAGGGSKQKGGTGSRASRKRDAQGDAKPGTQAGSSSSSSQADNTNQALPGGVSELMALRCAADALLLPELRDACLTAIQQQLRPDNALPLLLAAHQANLESLEAAVMAYAVQHIRGMWVALVSSPSGMVQQPYVLNQSSHKPCADESRCKAKILHLACATFLNGSY
jgi:hypothetical protein